MIRKTLLVGQHSLQPSMMHSPHLGPSVTDNMAIGLENLPSTNPFAMINKQVYSRARVAKGVHDEEEDDEDDDDDYGSCSSSPACGAAIISRRIERVQDEKRVKRVESSSVESSTGSSTTGGSSTSSSMVVERGGTRSRRKRKIQRNRQDGHKAKVIIEGKENINESDSHLAVNPDTSIEPLNKSKESQGNILSSSGTKSSVESIKSHDTPIKANRKRRRQTGHSFSKASQLLETISPEKLIVPQVWASSADDECEDEDEERDSESSNHGQFSPKSIVSKCKDQIIVTNTKSLQKDPRY